MELPEQEKEKRRVRLLIINNWIIFIAFLCVLVGGCIISVYLIISNINKCTSDPAQYLSERIQSEENVSYSNARIFLYLYRYNVLPDKIIDVNLTKNKEIKIPQ